MVYSRGVARISERGYSEEDRDSASQITIEDMRVVVRHPLFV